MRAHVGSGDGVTKASRCRTDEQDGDQTERDGHGGPARPGPGVEPPSRPGVDPLPEDAGDPTPAGDEHGGQLEQPVRQDQPEEQVGRPCAHMRPPISATLSMLLSSNRITGSPSTPSAMQSAAPRRCWSTPSGRSCRRVLAVVALEVVVDELVAPPPARSRATRRWGSRRTTPRYVQATTTLARHVHSHQRATGTAPPGRCR